ncbi:MAG: folate-binding protein YgfZ [Gammaproteobacteria bacterium]|nr:folate-binding protein YgfZ [Gammaproteobacteria bacterium]
MSNKQYPEILGNMALSDSTSDILQQNLLCQINNLKVIEIHGADAKKFLHGQLTNDVEALDKNTLQLNGYCDPKGRLIALFYLIRLTHKYLMIIDQSISSNVVKRLQMFVLMAEVKFEPSELQCIGFAQQVSNNTSDLITDAALSPCDASIDNNGLILARLDGELARHLIIGDNNQLGQAWSMLSKDNLICDNSVWRLLDIQQGQPTLIEKIQGAFIPQMMNLDLVGGLSFNKGCYPGQEVVARMHHLGKLKRRMYHLHIICTEQPLAGDGIYSSETNSNESAGKIVSIVKTKDNEFAALAVLQIKHKENKDLYLGDDTDTALSLITMPYEIKES